jgi:hypothetical protein
MEIAPHVEYVRLQTGHVTHSGAPEKFIELINNFAENYQKRDI